MEYACFTNKDKALSHRHTLGGWIAIDNSGLYFWFSPAHTITAVMTHKALHGSNAKFI